MLACTNASHAQQFMNGGFEPQKAITPCANVPVATYNSNMGHNRDISTAANMQIADASCGKGAPIAGSYFGVMDYMPPVSNIIVFKLDKPMTAGTAYAISVNYKIPAPTTATASLRFGYCIDSTKNDSLGGYTKQITNTAWIKDTLKFTPKKASQFIWLELGVLAGDPFTLHVDDLQMIGITIPPKSVAEIEHNNWMTLSPNPCTEKATLLLNEHVAMPYSMRVYDMTGRLISKKDGLHSRKAEIQRQEIGMGNFIIKVTDANGASLTQKLLVQ